jgi:DNA-directed RNA polymerase subunit RPC12/RpoP
MHSTEVEIACSTCDGSKVVIVPDIELPQIEESALEDVRCHECEGPVA